MRPISEDDFWHIVDRGLAAHGHVLPRRDAQPRGYGLAEEPAMFTFDDRAARLRALTTRAVRDPIFRSAVVRAYGARCAISGLDLRNGGGRAEVEAAHIQPVEHGGPDRITNGIALSGTVHWMFDRGLIGLSDGLEILISRKVNDVASVRRLINPDGRAHAPAHERDRPHPAFLDWHRRHHGFTP